MNSFRTLRRRLAGLLYPYQRLDRWLLGHWPTIWAERHHMALSLGVALTLAALVLGFLQGVTVSFVLNPRLHIPVELGLPAAPWCAAAAWFWSRAKTYGTLPLTAVTHGLYYGAFDLSLVLILLFIPAQYSWAFQAGLRAHLAEVEKVAHDELVLKTTWTVWLHEASSGISATELEQQLHLPPETNRKAFSSSSWRLTKDEFPELDKWTGDLLPANLAATLLNLGLQPQNLNLNLYDHGPPSTDPRLMAEYAKLEAILFPLAAQYMGVDLSPLSVTGRRGPHEAKNISPLLLLEDRSEMAFEDFNQSVSRYTEYADLSDIESSTWILFTILLTLLAIPATTVRTFWLAWGLCMTGGVVVLYFISVFSEFFTGAVVDVIYYGVPAILAAVLLLALTTQRIGKRTAVKMLSVFVPLILILLPFIIESDVAWPLRLGIIMAASVVARLMFSRLRSMPDPN